MQARRLWDGILEVLKEKINKQNQKEKKVTTKSIFPVNAGLQKYGEKKRVFPENQKLKELIIPTLTLQK